MKKIIQKFVSDQKGATLVELSLIMPIMFIVTFGIIEFGYIVYQYNAAVKATQVGAQYASTHSSVVTGLKDCGTTDYSAKAGTDCAAVAGYNASWSVTCPGGGGCDTGVMTDILTAMQGVYPNLEAGDVSVTLSGDPGLGYIGRGRPVPALTVTVDDMTYDYIAIGGLVNIFAGSIGASMDITSAQTTVIAEDLREGP